MNIADGDRGTEKSGEQPVTEQSSDHWITPQWDAPANVRALITTRQTLVGESASASPYDSFNLALHVDDEESAVLANRLVLQKALKVEHQPQWLEQIHSTKVVEAKSDDLVRTADASQTSTLGLPCVVMTADCLPILLCDTEGTQVAAVHAGWRGLAKGIVRDTLKQFSAPADQIIAYLGPAIGQNHFEVGIEVLEGFYDNALSPAHCEVISSAFRPSASHPMKFNADLYQLARAELEQLGVSSISGGDFCTVEDAERFYSYRRDGQTGRMASLIYLT
jgi:purine-nucleoside/S-methyl-5'-thioadenosine phosphorylase / adenosine deaminase